MGATIRVWWESWQATNFYLLCRSYRIVGQVRNIFAGKDLTDNISDQGRDIITAKEREVWTHVWKKRELFPQSALPDTPWSCNSCFVCLLPCWFRSNMIGAPPAPESGSHTYMIGCKMQKSMFLFCKINTWAKKFLKEKPAVGKWKRKAGRWQNAKMCHKRRQSQMDRSAH